MINFLKCSSKISWAVQLFDNCNTTYIALALCVIPLNALLRNRRGTIVRIFAERDYDEGRSDESSLDEAYGHNSNDQLPLQDTTSNGDAVKAGDLLKYLLAVNGNRNVGSSLRFGFTK